MKVTFRVGILGAGLGSRLGSATGAKPLAKLGKLSLLEHHLVRFGMHGASEIACALRGELLSTEKRAALPSLQGLSYIFVDTESSLHTLAELIRAMEPSLGPVLFTMADTVILPADLERFLVFCSSLGAEDNAVLLSSFVDDEKPLWAHVGSDGGVLSFGGETGTHVTSGMYFLQPEAMLLALAEVEKGTHKMRNFLSKLARNGFPIKSFVVAKTIDVDHPSDLEQAARFLHEG